MSLKVLLCDADPEFVQRAGRFLIGHGHQVISEPVIGEAAALVDHWKPDVVVVSSEAIECDSEGAFEKIKSLDNPPAVLLTGQLDRFEAAWRAWRKGADELLLKPVVQAWELHSAIITAIENSTGKSLGTNPMSATA